VDIGGRHRARVEERAVLLEPDDARFDRDADHFTRHEGRPFTVSLLG